MVFKKFFSLLILFLVIIQGVQAVDVVEVPKDSTPPKDEGFFSGTFAFLKSPIFWMIIVGLVILTAIIIGLVFLINWLVKFLKSQDDIFYIMKKDRIKMAKIHRKYNSNHWWKVEKNIPIRLVKKEGDKLIVSKPIGHHRGDYLTHEGNVIISLNLIGKKKWMIFPDTDLLIVLCREMVKIEQRDAIKNEKIITELNNLPHAKDIVQFNENEILIFAESLSSTGHFLIPVVKSIDGKVIDLSLPTFATLREVIMSDYLYAQTDDFGKLSKKAMEINPNIRAVNKVADSNQNVDLSGANQQ